MLTPEHLSQMRHAVGFYSDTEPGYRNHFSTEQADPIWRTLETMGYAHGRIKFGAFFFYVSESGKKLIGLDEQIALVKYMNEESFGVDE